MNHQVTSEVTFLPVEAARTSTVASSHLEESFKIVSSKCINNSLPVDPSNSFKTLNDSNK